MAHRRSSIWSFSPKRLAFLGMWYGFDAVATAALRALGQLRRRAWETAT